MVEGWEGGGGGRPGESTASQHHANTHRKATGNVFARGYKLVDLVPRGGWGTQPGEVGAEGRGGVWEREGGREGVFSLNLVDPLPAGRRRRRRRKRRTTARTDTCQRRAHACRRHTARKCYFCLGSPACLSGENAGRGGGSRRRSGCSSAVAAAALRLRVSVRCAELRGVWRRRRRRRKREEEGGRGGGGLVRSAGSSCWGICGRFVIESGRKWTALTVNDYSTTLLLCLLL